MATSSRADIAPKVLLAIMSYNRGQFLANLVESVKANFHFDYELIIYDDASDDPQTLSVLAQMKGQVVTPDLTRADNKHKGLYSNMQSAYTDALRMNADQLFIFQDDTQVIRSLDEQELKGFEAFFRSYESTAQITCTFFKKNHQKPYKDLLDYKEGPDMYLPKSSNSNYMLGLSDMGIYSVSKLKAKGWKFMNGEGVNQKESMALGLHRSVLRFPFLAFLPWPSVHRYKGNPAKKCYMWFSDRYFKAGFHPLNTLGENRQQQITNQKGFGVLFEDDILTLKNGERIPTPWNFYSSTFEWKRRVKHILGMKKHSNN